MFLPLTMAMIKFRQVLHHDTRTPVPRAVKVVYNALKFLGKIGIVGASVLLFPFRWSTATYHQDKNLSVLPQPNLLSFGSKPNLSGP